MLTRHLGHKPQVASSYGYAAPSDDPEVLLDLMQQAIDACGYTGASLSLSIARRASFSTLRAIRIF